MVLGAGLVLWSEARSLRAGPLRRAKRIRGARRATAAEAGEGEVLLKVRAIEPPGGLVPSGPDGEAPGEIVVEDEDHERIAVDPDGLERSAERILPGQRFWLVGRVRRVGQESHGAGYREHETRYRFTSAGEDRILLPAPSDMEAEASLTLIIAPAAGTPRRMMAEAAMAVAGGALLAYALARLF